MILDSIDSEHYIIARNASYRTTADIYRFIVFSGSKLLRSTRNTETIQGGEVL